jgi:ribulose-phosphate 3-epimerase
MKISPHALTFSASVRRFNSANLGAALRELESAGLAELKLDVADGSFVPEFGLSFDAIETVGRLSALPRHAHLQTEGPERFVETMQRLGCAAVTVPIEACLHAHRTLARIRDLGMAAGVSIQPGSALTKLEYMLGMVDHVVVPVRDAGVPSVPAAAFDRVRILRENLDYHESKAILHIEGRLDVADAARLAALGASRIVIDREEVLHTSATLRDFMDAVTRAKRTA